MFGFKSVRPLFIAGCLLPALGFGSESWFGVYMNGVKVGYSMTKESKNPSKPELRDLQSQYVLRMKLMDTPLDMDIRMNSTVDAKNRPVRVTMTTVSQGRTQVVKAEFQDKFITVKMDNSGQIQEQKIAIPAGVRLVDDPMSVISESTSKLKSGPINVYSLDATSMALVQSEVSYRGEQGTEVRGLYARGELYEIKDSRGVTKVYLSKDSQVLKVDALLQMTMIPEEAAAAKKMDANVRVDLGEVNALRPDKLIERAASTSKVELNISGLESLDLISDAYQTIKKEGNSWTLAIHPKNAVKPFSEPQTTLEEVRKQQTSWLSPSLHIPSEQPRFLELAKKIVGTETRAYAAAQKISRHVYAIMQTDASIGVLRNANEVLDSRRGVCRDYAILGATLARAVGIPTRLVSGLIYDSGQFYYHAWIECWTGSDWYAFDPTRAERPMDATRIKLRHGNVDDAFIFPVLSGAKFKVMRVQY